MTRFNFNQYTSPYNFHIATLDSRLIDPSSCSSFDQSAFQNNGLLFLLWWSTHSGLARSRVKAFFSIEDHPLLDRPLFAFVATNVWLLNIHLWRPVDTCHRFDLRSVSSSHWLLAAPILLFATILIVGGWGNTKK
jgi:hypothetical protein